MPSNVTELSNCRTVERPREGCLELRADLHLRMGPERLLPQHAAFPERRAARGGHRRCVGRLAQVSQEPLDARSVRHERLDLHAPAAAGASLDVQGEAAFHQLSPRAIARAMGRRLFRWGIARRGRGRIRRRRGRIRRRAGEEGPIVPLPPSSPACSSELRAPHDVVNSSAIASARMAMPPASRAARGGRACPPDGERIASASAACAP